MPTTSSETIAAIADLFGRHCLTGLAFEPEAATEFYVALTRLTRDVRALEARAVPRGDRGALLPRQADCPDGAA